MAKKTAKKAAKKKTTTKASSIKEMSAADLYKLAKQKEAEEAKNQSEASQKVLGELKTLREQLMKEVALVEKTISTLEPESKSAPAKAKRGRPKKATTKTTAKKASKKTGKKPRKLSGQTAKIFDAIKDASGPISVSGILEKTGIPEKKKPNVYTTLNILKKRGLVTSPERGMYKA